MNLTEVRGRGHRSVIEGQLEWHRRRWEARVPYPQPAWPRDPGKAIRHQFLHLKNECCHLAPCKSQRLTDKSFSVQLMEQTFTKTPAKN